MHTTARIAVSPLLALRGTDSVWQPTTAEPHVTLNCMGCVEDCYMVKLLDMNLVPLCATICGMRIGTTRYQLGCAHTMAVARP